MKMFSYAVVCASFLGFIVQTSLGEQPPDVKTTIQKGMWVPERMLQSLEPSKESGNRLLLVTVEIENSGNGTVDLSGKDDVLLFVTDGDKGETKTNAVKGIFIHVGFLQLELPKGVKLQTKGGWATYYSLDPKEQKFGTHLYYPLGDYKLALESGAKIPLPLLFEVRQTKDELKLRIKNSQAQKLSMQEPAKQ